LNNKLKPLTVAQDTVADFDAGEDIGVIKTKFDHGVKQGDPKRMLVWAGEGVAHMTQIQPAEVCFQFSFFLSPNVYLACRIL
jgi:hypothetical protein